MKNRNEKYSKKPRRQLNNYPNKGKAFLPQEMPTSA